MCHCLILNQSEICLLGSLFTAIAKSVYLDAVDPHLGVGLAMALQFLVLLLALEMEDQDLIPASLADYGAKHLASRGVGEGRLPVRKGQHVVEFHRAAGFDACFFDFDYLAWGDAILFTTRADHSVHKNPPRRITSAEKTS